MGGFCSCFHVSDDSTSDNNCFCPGCLLHMFKNKPSFCCNLFTQNQSNVVPALNQQAPASNPTAPAASRPHDRAVNGPRPLQAQHEPAGQSDVRVDTKPLQGVRTIASSNPMQRFKSYANALKLGADGFGHMFNDHDDECPTCLEEYTPENPKIMTKCNHHYHLSCIYEWMERSENCPVCAELMLFDESS